MSDGLDLGLCNLVCGAKLDSHNETVLSELYFESDHSHFQIDLGRGPRCLLKLLLRIAAQSYQSQTQQ